MNLYTAEGAGSKDVGMEINDRDNWWCHISGSRLELENCKVDVALKNAVKLSETLGYPLQALADGVEAICTGTDNRNHNLFFKFSGLFQDDLSFYMAEVGFVPYVKPTNGTEVTVKDAIRTWYLSWCNTVTELKKTTVQQALSGDCLTGNAGFPNKQVNEDIAAKIGEKCPGDPVECYRKLLDLRERMNPRKKAVKNNCDMLKTLVSLIELKSSWGLGDWQEQAALVPEVNGKCSYKTRAIATAQNLGMFVRKSSRDSMESTIQRCTP